MLAKDGLKVTFGESGYIPSKDGQEAIGGMGKNIYMPQSGPGNEEAALKAEALKAEIYRRHSRYGIYN